MLWRQPEKRWEDSYEWTLGGGIEIGAPTISSEERLVSKDKETGIYDVGQKPKRRFLKFLLQSKFVDVAMFRYTE
jgi:hypothetical protein